MQQPTKEEQKVLDEWNEMNASQTQHNVFYTTYKSSLLRAIESHHKREIVKFWVLMDFIPKGDEYVLCWKKRVMPLDDEDLKKIYGT